MSRQREFDGGLCRASGKKFKTPRRSPLTKALGSPGRFNSLGRRQYDGFLQDEEKVGADLGNFTRRGKIHQFLPRGGKNGSLL